MNFSNGKIQSAKVRLIRHPASRDLHDVCIDVRIKVYITIIMSRPISNHQDLIALLACPIDKLLISIRAFDVDTLSQIGMEVISCGNLTYIAKLPTIYEFIAMVAHKSKLSSQTLLVACVLLKRIKGSIKRNSKGLACTTHRIVLTAICIAQKYLYDSPNSNKTWAQISEIFQTSEINLMENQFLKLLVIMRLLRITAFSFPLVTSLLWYRNCECRSPRVRSNISRYRAKKKLLVIGYLYRKTSRHLQMRRIY